MCTVYVTRQKAREKKTQRQEERNAERKRSQNKARQAENLEGSVCGGVACIPFHGNRVLKVHGALLLRGPGVCLG